MRRVFFIVIWCVGLATPAVVNAHAFTPSLLALQQYADGTVDVTWKTPRLRVIGSDVQPLLPESCNGATAATVEEAETSITRRWQVHCGTGGLVGARLGIGGLAAANTNGFIRVALADGRTLQQVVTSTAPWLHVAAPPHNIDVWTKFMFAGMWHICGRLDRVLFLLGLVLLSGTTVRLLQTLVAFSVGHSITLAAASLGDWPIPSAMIEIAMALTILVLATELAREPRQTWIRRSPWIIGVGFGLLHGLGFAAALTAIGLPRDHEALSAFAFNAGIEIGQLSLLTAIVVGTILVRASVRELPTWIRQIPIYTIGSLGAFWCIERAAAVFR